MPPRISSGTLPGARPKKAKSQSAPRNSRGSGKSQRRAQNAFSIAAYEAPDRNKIRKSRLGAAEGPAHRKRARDEEEEEEEEEEEQGGVKRRRKGGDDSFDEGSDSEGNNWKMGHVDDDDDSEIDSDEAFGESDEERFEGWTFRGSSSNKPGKKAKKARPAQELDDEDEDIDLDEGDSADDEEDEDDLGEDAIDLATALDQYEEDEAEEKREKQKKKKKASTLDEDSDEAPSEVGDLAIDGFSDFSSEDEADEEDEEDRRAQLKDFISNMTAEEEENAPGPRKVEVHESSAPSEFGVMRKVDFAGFKSKTADAEKKRSLKLLEDDKSTKRNDLARKLEAPLPKRQQDKLDRAAAALKAKETLDRWTDTVKHNRRAEHLHFPLHQTEEGSRQGETRLLPTTTAEPANDLESTIQSILQQSGLSNGKDDEEQIQKWEALQTNKLPLAEVQKRRAQLRMERELLFREEVRAKRIKKIKSKSYRRVHRKERERLAEKERDELRANGIDISEDEREHNDRRRAEERMGAKHRDSKWAKGVKASGRSNWDDDARSGVTEMARRNEELRRRIEGKEVRDEGDDASDFSSDGDDDEEDEEGNEDLQRDLKRLKENPFSTDNSKLGSMAFMQKAEAARRARNDEDVERMRKELAGEESNSDGEDDNAVKAGRRKFGPNTKMAPPAILLGKSEFEERQQADSDEDGEATGTKSTTNGFSKRKPAAPESGSNGHNPYLDSLKKDKKSTSAGPDLVSQAYDTLAAVQTQAKAKPTKKAKDAAKPKQAVDESLAGVFAGNPSISKADDDGWQTVTYDDEDKAEDDDQDMDIYPNRNMQYTASAFAGDNVEAEFLAEKKETVEDEDTRVEKNVLPGWGNWAGDGLSKQEKRRKGEVTYKTIDGIAPNKRKDAKLPRVIVNEKRVKANTKYMSSQLPFPFETKEQYERSLRLPKGPEWTTKKSFQEATKPRVMVKQGVIKPMRKPLV